MTAIEKADNSYEDFNTFGVYKFWECPRCKEEFLFSFHDEEPWPFDQQTMLGPAKRQLVASNEGHQ